MVELLVGLIAIRFGSSGWKRDLGGMASINGMSGNDTLFGTGDPDVIRGFAGDDEIYSRAGADVLYGGFGWDTAYGGDGDDTIRGGSGDDGLYGEAGDDVIVGGRGGDFIHGGAGDNVLFGDYQIELGEGDDVLDDGEVELVQDDSDDISVERVSAESGSSAAATDYDDWLIGGSGNDIIFGQLGKDFISSNGGDDVLSGGSGDDELKAGSGDDVLLGGAGDDLLRGQSGHDDLFGGVGNDVLKGGRGHDWLFGGVGDDELKGGRGRDTVDGGAGDDIVRTGKGNDESIYTMAENAGATDYYGGGKGIDTLVLDLTTTEWFNADVQTDIADFLDFLAANTDPITGQANGNSFQFTAFDLTARRFEDLVVLVDGVELDPEDAAANAVDDAETISSDAGPTDFGSVLDNDLIPDLAQSVSVVSVSEEGLLSFNTGTDGAPDGTYTFDPGTAFDDLASGEERDFTFLYEVTDADGDTDQATVTITVTGAEEVCPTGESIGTEQYKATVNADNIVVTEGFAGIIAANDGDDTVNGGGYDDYLLGNNGDDVIYGNCGDDWMEGGQNNDEIHGGAGDDRLAGNRGTDVLYGDAGSDTFFFKGKVLGDGETDTIKDFVAGEDGIEITTDLTVSYAENGGDVEVSVDGMLEMVVENALAADVEAATTIL